MLRNYDSHHEEGKAQKVTEKEGVLSQNCVYNPINGKLSGKKKCDSKNVHKHMTIQNMNYICCLPCIKTILKNRHQMSLTCIRIKWNGQGG